jgi:hypothetical protein
MTVDGVLGKKILGAHIGVSVEDANSFLAWGNVPGM